MEKTISASFRSQQELEHAVRALRKQGAIDIRVSITPPSPNRQVPLMSGGHTLSHGTAEMAEEFVFGFDVYVEPSRFRQAEDTIAQCGGRFNTSPKW